MRLKNDEYTLLKRIHWELLSCGKEGLAAELQNLLTRFEVTREKTREHNRLRPTNGGTAQNRLRGGFFLSSETCGSRRRGRDSSPASAPPCGVDAFLQPVSACTLLSCAVL